MSKLRIVAKSEQDGREWAINLAKLRKLCESTGQPSPWTVTINKDDDNDATVLDDNGCWVAHVGRAPDDAKFIAAASPAVVLALLNHIEKSALKKRARKPKR